MENVYICQIFFLCSGDHWLNQDSLKFWNKKILMKSLTAVNNRPWQDQMYNQMKFISAFWWHTVQLSFKFQ